MLGDLFVRRRRQTNIAGELHLMPQALHRGNNRSRQVGVDQKGMPSYALGSG
jgi:hypothetical protein